MTDYLTLRKAPAQSRSASRLDSLLDAAAEIISEVGMDRLTTTLVAERANCSIGTLYRYFPERVSLLRAVADRSLERFRTDYLPALRQSAEGSWEQCLDAAFEHAVHAFRTVPGFRALRLGGILDVRPRMTEGWDEVAAALVQLSPEQSAVKAAELRRRLSTVIIMVDALLSRAFLFDPNGDPVIIAEARAIARSYLR